MKLWIGRTPSGDWSPDRYKIVPSKRRPEFRHDGYFANSRGLMIWAIDSFCATEFHKLTGTKLKRGEISEVKAIKFVLAH